MIEPTEREKKLLGYIVFLINVLNFYTMFLGYSKKNSDALEGRLDELKVNSIQEEMVSYLKGEFSIPFNLVKDKDVIDKQEGKER